MFLDTLKFVKLNRTKRADNIVAEFMKKVYLYKEKRRIKVGKIYDFFVVKRLKIPGGDEYFVLKDPFDEKHLLPTSFYQDYGIKKEQFLKCHVDKVNCKGQIFLEPLHPVYSVGTCYDFKFMESRKSVNRKGMSVIDYIFEGKDGSLAYLPQKELSVEPNSKIWKKYKVINIKKAKIYLGLLC